MNAIALSPEQTEFLNLVAEVWQNQNLDRIICSQYKGEEAELQKITFRPVTLKNQLQVKVVYRYKTKDITKNYTWEEFQDIFANLLNQCEQVNLFTLQVESQLKTKKGKAKLTHTKIKGAPQAIKTEQHNREKKRFVEQEAAFLQHLGITDEKHQIIPSMAKKWKQINKFVEIFAQAISQAKLNEQDVHVVDFGSGKGYLTCAVYDYMLKHKLVPHVTGVELQEKLVDFCQNVADQVGYDHLKFFQGDVRSYEPKQTDVMIALHACDIATDFAIHTGIRLNASLIMCAPCCHKELRPQLKPNFVMQPMLQFGVHAGQQAEMLTDSLRALLLKAYGYETKILEFVPLEHTSKNKMILAIKNKDISEPDAKILAQIEELKTFYGIQKQSLQLLLNNEWDQQGIGSKC